MTREFLGYMYMARRPCGRVSASAWDKPGLEKSTAKFVAMCIQRGDVIERVQRYRGDPMPEWICEDCRGKKCEEEKA